MNIVTRSLRPSIQALEPYQWEPMSDEIKQRYGVDRVLRFDANTMATPPGCYDRFLDFVKQDRQVSEYKDFSYQPLQKLVAGYSKVAVDQVVITASGDEGIDIVTKAFLNDGDRVIISSPTYSMYKIQTGINGGETIDIPLIPGSFALDADKLIAATEQAKILFICNPNNPTGTVNPRETIERIVRQAGCMVLVDEAYFEFNDREGVQDLISTCDNLIILRTFSKFAAMAGARVGYLLTSPCLAAKLNAIRLPMGISYFSMELAKMVLAEDMVWVEQNLRTILTERSRMAEAYTALGLQFYPSRTNFFLVRYGEQASKLVQHLMTKGLVLRDLSSKMNIEGCIRITVRSPDENDQLISALKEALHADR